MTITITVDDRESAVEIMRGLSEHAWQLRTIYPGTVKMLDDVILQIGSQLEPVNDNNGNAPLFPE